MHLRSASALNFFDILGIFARCISEHHRVPAHGWVEAQGVVQWRLESMVCGLRQGISTDRQGS
jgi:hypothetical protein